MAERILVAFEGAGAGVGELSWGQREMWGAMQRSRNWMPIGAVLPLPAGTTVDDVVADLRFLMGRYPTLRTRLRLGPDGATQVVSGSGEVALEIVDAAPGADPAEVAERVRRRYWDTAYDVATGWPVRMAVIRHRGVPTHRVWVMCHLVTDAAGAAIMMSELAARDTTGRDTTGRDTTGGVAAMPPIAQAQWQRSPAGQRQCELALRHWDRLLRTVPAHRFPEPAHRPRPRYWNGTFTSAALPAAVDAVAARAGTGVSAVLLAAFALALARVTGVNPVVARVVVNNRFRPGLAATVSPIVHNGLCVLDVAGTALDVAAARTRRAALTAYKYAYYDPPRLDELIARVNGERGEEVDLGCFFNDRRQPSGGGVPASPPRAATPPESTFRWHERQDSNPYDRFFLTVDDAPGALTMSVFIDTHHVSPAHAEACARGMETEAVAAAGQAGSRR